MASGLDAVEAVVDEGVDDVLRPGLVGQQEPVVAGTPQLVDHALRVQVAVQLALRAGLLEPLGLDVAGVRERQDGVDGGEVAPKGQGALRASGRCPRGRGR